MPICLSSTYRRPAAIRALERLGVTGLGYGDPIEWEQTLATRVNGL